MKQMKFLMVALTLLTGVLMSSCIDSGDESKQGAVIGKLSGGLYGGFSLEGTDGYTYTFSAESIASLESAGADLFNYVGQVLYVAYDAEGATIDDTEKTAIGVALSGFMSLNNSVGIVHGEVPAEPWNIEANGVDSIGNAPIVSFTPSSGSEPIFIFDNYTLHLPVEYNICYSGNTVYSHYISLIYYPDEETEDNTLNLHLRYHTYGDTTTSSLLPASQTYNPYYYAKFYDLTGVINRYEMEKGDVEKVNIKYYKNEYSLEMQEGAAVEENYVLDRSHMVEQ